MVLHVPSYSKHALAPFLCVRFVLKKVYQTQRSIHNEIRKRFADAYFDVALSLLLTPVASLQHFPNIKLTL